MDNIEANFEISSDNVNLDFSLSDSSGTKDHNALSNRNIANQHPISAITNLQDTLDTKQSVITDLDEIRDGANKGTTAYQKPSTGIPKSDLENGVQTSLNKADTSVQNVSLTHTYTNGNIKLGLSINGGANDV